MVLSSQEQLFYRMKAKIFALLAFTFIMSYPAQGVEPAGQSINLSDSILDVRGGDGEKWSVGSGFVHQKGYVLTTDHIISSSEDTEERIELRTGDEKRWRSAKIIRRDPENDIAILQAEGLPDSGITLDSALEPGDNLTVSGNDGSTVSSTVSRVNVSVVTEEKELEDTIEFDALVYQGDSGAPIITEEGAAGVITARRGEETGYAVPSSIFEDLIAE